MRYTMKQCGVIYAGPSCPEAHGIKCTMPAGHDEAPPSKTWAWNDLARHWAFSGDTVNRPIGWYTSEQKKAHP